MYLSLCEYMLCALVLIDINAQAQMHTMCSCTDKCQLRGANAHCVLLHGMNVGMFHPGANLMHMHQKTDNSSKQSGTRLRLQVTPLN